MRVSQEEARDNGPGSVLNEYSFCVIISGKASWAAGRGPLTSSLQYSLTGPGLLAFLESAEKGSVSIKTLSKGEGSLEP